MKRCRIYWKVQASYTDFHYLRPVWQRNTEKDYLIGVSMTGIASGTVLKLDMKQAAKVVKETNADLAKKIGIKPAARCTTVKPAGTTSLTLGTSSGIHAWHNEHYIRRIRVGKNEPIYSYLVENHPNLIEDEFLDYTILLSSPCRRKPQRVLLRERRVHCNLLRRVKKVHAQWVKAGHRKDRTPITFQQLLLSNPMNGMGR